MQEHQPWVNFVNNNPAFPFHAQERAVLRIDWDIPESLPESLIALMQVCETVAHTVSGQRS
jgi:hypothetical protein